MEDLIKKLIEQIEGLDLEEKVVRRNTIVSKLNKIGSIDANPVGAVLLVPIEKVQANDYNPNSVAIKEMGLLYTSIKEDGYTQPVVTYYDKENDKYVIVDGFHRHLVMKHYDDIRIRCNGYLPVVCIEKDINDRMSSTVRHNRARGHHSVTGMSNIIFNMLDNGRKDEDICKNLGLEADELVRLKHITGFSKLFENVEYKKAWETKTQLKIKKKYKDFLDNNDGSKWDLQKIRKEISSDQIQQKQ